MKEKIGYVLIGMMLIVALLALLGANGRQATGRYTLSTTTLVDEPLENITLVVTILDTETGAFTMTQFTHNAVAQAKGLTFPFLQPEEGFLKDLPTQK